MRLCVVFAVRFASQLQTGPARLNALGGEAAEESVPEAGAAQPPVSHCIT